MNFRSQLRKSLDQENKRKRGGRYSKAYHRFFEGYSEARVPNADGKGSHIERVYTGNFYRQDLAGWRRILLRAVYVALYGGAVYLFISTAAAPLAANTTWYVVIAQVAVIPCLFWVMIALLSYLPTRQNLTIESFRSSSLALRKATIFSAIALTITALAALFFWLAHRASGQPGLITGVKYLTGGILVLAINRIEIKVRYQIIPSQHQPPSGAIEIE